MRYGPMIRHLNLPSPPNMSKDTNPTNAFPSGFDRWLSLQLTSQRTQKRATILNSLEELRFKEVCKQIDATLQIENGKREVVNEKLNDNLKENRLYWGALHRAFEKSPDDDTENPPLRPMTSDLLPYGRYQGRCFTNMATDVQKQRDYVKQMRMRHVTELLKISKKESSVVIDRKISTEDLLDNAEKPLSQRLQRTRTAKLKSAKAKANAVASKFADLHGTVKDKGKADHVGFVFKTDCRDEL